MGNTDLLRKTIRYRDKTFFVDLTPWREGKNGAIIDVVEPDGSRREALTSDGNLWEILSSGHVIPEENYN